MRRAADLERLPSSTILWVVALAAASARLLVGVVTGGLWHPDLQEYDDLARAMLAGRGYTYQHLGVVYHSFAAPMLSWITAGVYWLTGSAVPLMLILIAASVGQAVLTASLARRLFGSQTAALTAGLLTAVHPGLVYYSATKSHPMTLDALFFTLVLWQTLRIAAEPRLPATLTLGAIVGLGALSRATTLVFFPIAALWLLLRTPASERVRMLSQLFLAGLVALAVLTPWTIRNVLVHHRFVLIQTTDGELLWRGNNPNATGHSFIEPGKTVLETLTPDERAEMRRQPDEIAQSAWFKARAMAFIEAHPGEFVRLTLLKLYHFWWFAPQTGTLYPARYLRVYQLFYVGLLLLTAVGVGRLWRRGADARWQGLLIFLFMLALSGLQSLYYVEGRHRWAIEPMMIVVAGGGAAALLVRRTTSPSVV